MTRLWVVVADAAHARFFARARADGALREDEALAMTAPPVKAPQDRLARVHDRFGPGRHNIEKRLSPALARERAFLAGVASALDRELGKDSFDALVLSAPPRAAGYLRAQLSDAVESRLRSVWMKDLTKVSARSIEKRLAAGLNG